MTSQQAPTLSISKIYSNTFSLLRKNPVLFLPFGIFAFVEMLFQFILYNAPRGFLRPFFGPIIRAWWGEQFLHFPMNFLLLPKLVSYSKIALSVAVGSFCAGMAVILIYELYHKKHAKVWHAVRAAFNKYIFVFLVMLFLYAAYVAVTRGVSWLYVKFIFQHGRLMFLRPPAVSGPILFGVNILIGYCAQLLFIYVIPVLLVEEKRFFPSIGYAFVMLKRLFSKTAILVLLPALCFIPVAILNYNITFIMDKTFPEMAVFVLAVSSLLNSLVVDPVVSYTTTFYYLASRKKE